ncbi:MAG: SDR family oxidoreductase [Gammaproteobacteria bacterium]|nr:MAG: SDR family oxidoreductase [Gammaproteobacteria bacterium]
MSERILILGATSGIARGVAHALARRGHRLLLAARDRDELERLASDLRIRYGTEAGIIVFDVLDEAQHDVLCAALEGDSQALDGVVCAIGYLGDQERAFREADEARRIMRINYEAPALLLNRLAAVFEARGSGWITGIASVAGDRGRQSNFIYGSAKGGFALYLQGLRNRLARHGVQVLTVKPGFVDTAMTWGLPGLFLVADPMKVGEAIVRAREKGRNEIYVPGFWRLIMSIIRSIPEAVFKRLSL